MATKSKNVVRIGDKKPVVLVLESAKGKYKVEVVKDTNPKYARRPYQYRAYVSGQPTGGGSGFTKSQVLMRMARMKWHSERTDPPKLHVRHDTIGFLHWYAKATE